MEIELVNAEPSLIEDYKREITRFIRNGMITLNEWNSKFKKFRDKSGYSIIHYLIASENNLDTFITMNPIMLKNKKVLQKRFGVKIQDPNEFVKENKGVENRK
ncbi:MAG: hypothetical protein AABY22_32690 [Nanoarchaeota archaeon]